MKTSTKKLENCQYELSVDLDTEEAKGVVSAAEKRVMQKASMPGFRPGKMPIALVRKHFADAIKGEAVQGALKKYQEDAVKAEKLEIRGTVGVKSVTMEGDKFSYVSVVETNPVFKLPTYKGLKIAKADTEVTSKMIDEQLERLREGYADYEDAKEGDKIAMGDLVQIDYSGTVGGKPIDEIVPDAKLLAKNEGFWLSMEDGRFLPEILKALKGMKAGESKDGVKAVFDKEVAPEGLKGEKALYDISVKMIRKRILPDDETLAKKAQAESIDAIKEKIRKTTEDRLVKSEARRREEDAIEMLLKKVDFEVPGTILEHATEDYAQMFLKRLQNAGAGEDVVKSQAEKILKDASDLAARQIRLHYIFNEIAKVEKIEPNEKGEVSEKVLEFVLANSK